MCRCILSFVAVGRWVDGMAFSPTSSFPPFTPDFLLGLVAFSPALLSPLPWCSYLLWFYHWYSHSAPLYSPCSHPCFGALWNYTYVFGFSLLAPTFRRVLYKYIQFSDALIRLMFLRLSKILDVLFFYFLSSHTNTSMRFTYTLTLSRITFSIIIAIKVIIKLQYFHSLELLSYHSHFCVYHLLTLNLFSAFFTSFLTTSFIHGANIRALWFSN